MSTSIRTTHVGSLPRPEQLLHSDGARGERREPATSGELASAVRDVVARQTNVGIDVVNDGEYGHSMGQRYDYRAWWSYVFERLGGLQLVEADGERIAGSSAAKAGELGLAAFNQRRDRVLFADAYQDPASGCSLPGGPGERPVCRGPLSYVGFDQVERDIKNLKDALQAAGLQDGYLNSVAPASCARFANEYYSSDEEFLYACADAMREEYRAIIDAGLMLQLDDPAIAENWDQMNPVPSIDDYKRFTRVRIEALNHAIRDLPAERIRFHLCWGSWHGPHTTDIPLAEIVDLMLAVNAGSYSFEAANARHEHEWAVWQDVELPAGKTILPGIVSHSTNVVEHPELVAQRIERFAAAVGPESVIASTDCGLGGRVHPQIAWAKLEALVEGARVASGRLSRRRVPSVPTV